MKQFFKMAVIGLAAVAAFASCEKEDFPSQQEIETKIVGQWKCVESEGKETLTDQRSILTYMVGGKETASLAKTHEVVGFIWSNKEPYSYQVKENELMETRLSNGQNLYTDILSINNDRMEKILKKVVYPDGRISEPNLSMVFSKITPNNFSEDIIGMWEGVEMTGYETYGNAEARIEYKADGTYKYYTKVNDVWQYKPGFNEWNVDGDWLATRWQNEGEEQMNYEWWDIDEIKDGMMKWSALREKEDGERYTTTFTWKKIERPSDQEIKKNIVGKWKSLTYDGMPLETVERDILTFNADGTEEYSASRFDTELEEYIWSNKGAYTYSISNGVLTETIEDGRIGFTAEVLRADEDILVVNYTSFWKDGEQTATNDLMVFQKVTVDYSDDVIGLWECEDYVDAVNDIRMKVRFEFNADGSYSYYKYADGEWQKSKDTSIEYLVDGDWIAVRYRTDMDTFTFAAWDINEVKDGTMKWSYLIKKADGTPLTTTIDWKRVD